MILIDFYIINPFSVALIFYNLILFRELEALFGKNFWDNVILEFTHWAYDMNSVMTRNRTGKKYPKALLKLINTTYPGRGGQF